MIIRVELNETQCAMLTRLCIAEIRTIHDLKELSTQAGQSDIANLQTVVWLLNEYKSIGGLDSVV